MSTMNVSLPESLEDFVDDQVCRRGYSSSSEYVRKLIRKVQDRQHLRGLLLEGAARPVVKAIRAHAGVAAPVDIADPVSASVAPAAGAVRPDDRIPCDRIQPTPETIECFLHETS
jgi:putative addiction module CopG family antidote